VVHGVLGQGGDPERKKNILNNVNRWHNILTLHPNIVLGNPIAGKKNMMAEKQLLN
jgi:hypothetical protein